jgi:hypothetical protein
VDNVYPVTWNKDAFKRLVLPHSTKDLVETLIKAHASPNLQQGGPVSGKRLDLIAGKGLGLIMLLHGSPGTGKTLTAGKPTHENMKCDADISLRKVCITMSVSSYSIMGQLTAEINSVAEIAEMPLYSVTCGDIGIQVEQVERYLQTVLYLGKKWNCGTCTIN